VGGKERREKRKRLREALRPYKDRLLRTAAALFAQGEGSWAKALHLAAAATLGSEPSIALMISALDREGPEGAVREAEKLLEVALPVPPRQPPPEGWGFMKELLAELRAEGLAQARDDGSLTPLFILATELAHFSPMYRAMLGWKLYELYGGDRSRLLSLYQSLVHRLPALEAKDPLIRRVFPREDEARRRDARR